MFSHPPKAKESCSCVDDDRDHTGGQVDESTGVLPEVYERLETVKHCLKKYKKLYKSLYFSLKEKDWNLLVS